MFFSEKNTYMNCYIKDYPRELSQMVIFDHEKAVAFLYSDIY